MTIVIIIIGSIAAMVGVGVATWSIVSTRKKYHECKVCKNSPQKRVDTI